MKYAKNTSSKRQKRGLSVVLVILATLVVLAGASAIGVRYWYQQQLAPLSKTSSQIIVNIPTGASVKQIALLLEQQKVIKSARAFEWYVRNNDLRDSLQAGQYALDPSQSVGDIANVISKGKVQQNRFTILPAQRIDQIRAAFLKAGYSETAVDAALNPSNYKNHPALVAKPTNASLEGYLYPETFQTTSTTTPTEIVKQSLDEMAQALTPDLIDQFQKQGLGIHQAVTLASIVEQEVPSGGDRRMVAQVFLNRLRAGIALGSDVTYHYAAVITGQQATPFIDSPYNTRKYAGLPPGPISNVSKSSLNAVANPSPNDYLFFVAGDDGKTYFSKTQAEHDALTRQYCKVLCSTY